MIVDPRGMRILHEHPHAVRPGFRPLFDSWTAQVEAEGAGFLAPRASNLSETGRAENRRVEVVLLSVEIE